MTESSEPSEASNEAFKEDNEYRDYILEGSKVFGITDLYSEFNRLFMADSDWQLGETLDGLNDVLYSVAAGISLAAESEEEAEEKSESEPGPEPQTEEKPEPESDTQAKVEVQAQNVSAPQKARVIWLDHQHSKTHLALAETERWLLAKLEALGVFNTKFITKQLEELRLGTGKSYFELVLEVFADHPEIELELR